MGTRSNTIYVLSRNMKNIRFFLSENFQFLVVNFSIYLNRRVFVMYFQLIQLQCGCPGTRIDWLQSPVTKYFSHNPV